jgi:predicted transcriptional regulator of viral defense system
MDRRERNTALMNFAAAHGGIVTPDLLRELGLDQNAILGRVRRHGWISMGRGCYQLFPPRDYRDVLTVAVTVLERAVISHESAAEVHEFSRVPSGRAVVTVHSRTTHDFGDLEVHRAHDLDPDHITYLSELPVTTVERTVVDLAASRSPAHVGAIVDDLFARGRLDIEELGRVANAVARRGKPGTVTMREVLEARVGSAHPQSELERRARELLVSAGLPLPVAEYPIPWAERRRFDDAYPEQRLAIEWDSRRYHGQLAAFEADRERDRSARLHGWTVIRFTWADVHERPFQLVETVRQLLNLAS